MPISHNFVAPIADEGDPDIVGPDEWNDDHTIPAHDELSGLTDDDHTQYVLRSILTTNGDLFTRAGGVIARLGIGSAGDVLTVSGGAPVWTAHTHVTDHGGLSGLADDDHPQYTTEAEVDTIVADHAGEADPHTGYRLESADHTHQSTGAQAGQLDHGAALTGLTDDDHTQYLLLAGRGAEQDVVGGLTLSTYLHVGSNSSPTNTTAGDATVSRLSVADTAAFSTTGYLARFGGTLTDTANGATIAYVFSPALSPASNSLADFRVINMSAAISPSTGVTMDTITAARFETRYRTDAAVGSVTGLYANAAIIDSSSPAAWGTLSTAIGLSVQPIISLDTSKTGTVTSATGIDLDVLNTGGASFTVTTAKAINIRNPAASSTMTTLIGLDIAQLTRATTNIGIRNAGTTVLTPSTAQDITATSEVILADASIVLLTADGDYTLASTPTIADGQNGQVLRIINVDSANIITLQDQGTLGSSNLRLAAATVALGPRDSIELTYSSAVGDWVQTGFMDVL
jgi:hypothetical protein